MKTVIRGPRGPRGFTGAAGAPGAGYEIQRQVFTGDGVTDTFPLAVACVAARRKAAIVFRGGLGQGWVAAAPATASEFAISGTDLIFGIAPLEGQRIEIIYDSIA